MSNIEIETSEQALTLALKLAIQAPTDEQHKLATDMAMTMRKYYAMARGIQLQQQQLLHAIAAHSGLPI